MGSYSQSPIASHLVPPQLVCDWPLFCNDARGLERTASTAMLQGFVWVPHLCWTHMHSLYQLAWLLCNSYVDGDLIENLNTPMPRSFNYCDHDFSPIRVKKTQIDHIQSRFPWPAIDAWSFCKRYKALAKRKQYDLRLLNAPVAFWSRCGTFRHILSRSDSSLWVVIFERERSIRSKNWTCWLVYVLIRQSLQS